MRLIVELPDMTYTETKELLHPFLDDAQQTQILSSCDNEEGWVIDILDIRLEK